MSTYKVKYLKYKQKNLELESRVVNQLGGNTNNLIIHVSGPSGVGKTTLGNKLKNEFGGNIIVKDFDDLRQEFIMNEYGKKKFKIIDKEKYQLWIDDFISKQTKPLILTGLNHMPWWHESHYYETHAQHKYYIYLDNDVIFKQACKRFVANVFCDRQDKLIKGFVKNNKNLKKIQNAIGDECNYDLITERNNIWNRDYKKQGYEFLPRENIFEEISKILKNN